MTEFFLILPCPPRVFDAEGLQIKQRVKKIFEMLCPQSLQVVEVQPISIKMEKYNCAWMVEYEDSEISVAATNKQILRLFQTQKPAGCDILLKRKNNLSGKWIVHYGIPDCGCDAVLLIKKEDDELNEINNSLSDVKFE